MHAGSNVVSVAEHVVMLILSLVRNYLPAHKQILDGGWDIGQAAEKAYDLQNKVVGTVGTGRIGTLVLERLKASILPSYTIIIDVFWSRIPKMVHESKARKKSPLPTRS